MYAANTRRRENLDRKFGLLVIWRKEWGKKVLKLSQVEMLVITSCTIEITQLKSMMNDTLAEQVLPFPTTSLLVKLSKPVCSKFVIMIRCKSSKYIPLLLLPLFLSQTWDNKKLPKNKKRKKKKIVSAIRKNVCSKKVQLVLVVFLCYVGRNISLFSKSHCVCDLGTVIYILFDIFVKLYTHGSSIYELWGYGFDCSCNAFFWLRNLFLIQMVHEL